LFQQPDGSMQKRKIFTPEENFQKEDKDVLSLERTHRKGSVIGDRENEYVLEGRVRPTKKRGRVSRDQGFVCKRLRAENLKG